jgi:hypothetical protein
VNGESGGTSAYSAMARLAAQRGGETARYVMGNCIDQAIAYWEYDVARAGNIDAWTASELLLGLQAILSMKNVD